jgi:peptide/nickel transport system substrate-binding protein
MGGHTLAAAPGGSELIGQLEGPEVVTDPAAWPKSRQEAPQLAELVKAGKLPPVQERVSQEPLVIKPGHEIGKYGGTWRRGFSGPVDLRPCTFLLPSKPTSVPCGAVFIPSGAGAF